MQKKSAQKQAYRILKCLLVWLLLGFAPMSRADEKSLPDLDPKFYTLQETNPTRDAGYVVGDTLDRTLVITIKKPYELVHESLPIVGYEHRWKGQISGVELVNIQTEDKLLSDSVQYTLNLRYQVFTTGRTVKHASLKAETLHVRNTQTKEIVRLRAPFFDFRVSPLSLLGQIKLNEDMSPFVVPFDLNATNDQTRLKWYGSLLIAALLGLLYIFGVYAWLPRMGGPFAKAYRSIRQIPNSTEGLQYAVSQLHESLNKTAGSSLFNNNINTFIQNKPAFTPLKQEIEQFFGLSNQVFFESKITSNVGDDPKAWLQHFCRQLRDCERGLTPTTKANQ
ncbi:MAG: hypothetical protein WBP13_08655 [Methylophilaceae bacterium]